MYYYVKKAFSTDKKKVLLDNKIVALCELLSVFQNFLIREKTNRLYKRNFKPPPGKNYT